MDLASSSIDLVIANHVLEHVADDGKALSELFRILAPGGYAVLQTPYSRKLHTTWSDPGINTGQARLHAHGQEDHVRLFGRDIFQRITAAGFQSQVRRHEELLPDVDPREVGVNPAEPFFLLRKPGLVSAQRGHAVTPQQRELARRQDEDTPPATLGRAPARLQAYPQPLPLRIWD